MYIDSHTVVTLEFHCYQNLVQYSKLGVVDEYINTQNQLVDADGNIQAEYALGTDKYQADLTKDINNNSQFDRIDVKNLFDMNNDVIGK